MKCVYSSLALILGLLAIVLYVFFSTATSAYKVCPYSSPNKELRIYNDVLIELVERHFYNRYLGDEVLNDIFGDWHSTEDSLKIANIHQRLRLAQNALFNCPAAFNTLYMDTTLSNYLPTWQQVTNNTDSYSTEIKAIVDHYSPGQKAVMHSLNSPQKAFSPADFQACTFRVASFEKVGNYYDGIGTVRLSKVYTNKDCTKGLIYYKFFCGPSCGMGEIVMIEIHQGRWRIKSTYQIWIG